MSTFRRSLLINLSFLTALHLIEALASGVSFDKPISIQTSIVGLTITLADLILALVFAGFYASFARGRNAASKS